MARKTIYNNIVTQELWEQVNEENKELVEDFVEYKESADKSPKTIYQYYSALKIFFVWNLQHNKNIFFADLKKKDLIKFSNYLIKDLKSSPNRRSFMKSTLSSFSNYVEDVLSDEDDRFRDFRNLTKIIEITNNSTIRKKTIVTEIQFQDCLDNLVKDKKYQLACFFALAGYSGARKSELLRFKLEDFENIVFNNKMYKTKEPIKTKGRGSQGKLLYKYTLVDFKPYLDLWLNEREKLGLKSEYLFIKRNGTNATVAMVNGWAQKIGTKYLHDDLYFHAMRHYYTTQMKRKGVPDDAIVEVMGWSKSGGSAMLSIYSDISVEETMEGAFDVLSDVEG